MSGESSRFTHLLQPIRDLSKNWNIDLAQELEEYLDELEHLNIAFDPQDDDAGTANFSQTSTAPSQAGGGRVMNFAEAALLIQGTSVIYSRKVEYLYALVFQTLAHLSKQHETHQHRNLRDHDGGDIDDDQNGGDGDAHNMFMNPLPIYDELEEARNITLKSNSAQTFELQKQRSNGGGSLGKSNTNIQAAISLMGSLIPDERDHGETFKLLSCNLHSSGVLLLDEASKKYLSADFYENGPSGFATASSSSSSSRFDSMPVAALNFDNVADDFFMDGGNDDNYGDDDDDGNNDGADYGYNDDFGAADGDGANNAGDADIAADGGRQVSFATPNAGARTATRSRHEERDPWTPLDPYDTSSAMTRPFRKGRSYPRKKKEKHSKTNKKGKGAEDEDEELLDGLDDPQFKERFFFGASRPQWSSWVWTETNETALETKFKKKFCKAPLLVKSCEKLWKLETKWKSLVRRCEAKEEQSAQAILLQEQAEEEEEQMHAMGMNLVNGANALDLDLQAHGDVNDDDDDDDDDNGDGGADGFDAGDWDQGGQEDGPANYMDTSIDAMKDYDDPDRPLTYEDICRQHIRSFMQGTEKYVRETDLSKQVNDWQTRLNPILKEQDQHPPFDIHTCGREIIGHLEQETKVKQEEPKRKKPKAQKAGSDAEQDDGDEEVSIPFGEIVGGMSQYQVCRMFLASLQLANNGNVLLMHGKTASEQGKVPFEMQLLSTSNVYESLQQEA